MTKTFLRHQDRVEEEFLSILLFELSLKGINKKFSPNELASFSCFISNLLRTDECLSPMANKNFSGSSLARDPTRKMRKWMAEIGLIDVTMGFHDYKRKNLSKSNSLYLKDRPRYQDRSKCTTVRKGYLLKEIVVAAAAADSEVEDSQSIYKSIKEYSTYKDNYQKKVIEKKKELIANYRYPTPIPKKIDSLSSDPSSETSYIRTLRNRKPMNATEAKEKFRENGLTRSKISAIMREIPFDWGLTGKKYWGEERGRLKRKPGYQKRIAYADVEAAIVGCRN